MKHRGRVIAGFFAGLLVTAGVLTLAQQQNNQQQNNQSTQSKAGNQSTQPSASGAAASGMYACACLHRSDRQQFRSGGQGGSSGHRRVRCQSQLPL